MVYHLHSTMYLLNHTLLESMVSWEMNLHSTMYLLNQMDLGDYSKINWIYIPLCIY